MATDIVAAVPPGYYIEIMLRSSLTKRGLMLANGVGILDSDYTGADDKIYVPLCKCHKGKDTMQKGRGYTISTFISESTEINKGERIAQLIIKKSYLFDVEDMTGAENNNPVRGGFGATNG